MVMNASWQNNPRRLIHTFIYSVPTDWTNIFLPEMIHNSELLCFNSAAVVHHPRCRVLVCMCASLQPPFILLSLCHREPQELIFSAGFVVKPLAAAALGVSFPPSIDRRRTKSPESAGVDSCASVNPEQRPVTSLPQLWISLCTN